MALEITTDNIEETLSSKKITVIDFWAAWCGPCKMISPIIDELSTENQDVTIGKVNVDSEIELARKYGVRGIPTLLFFKNGEVADKIVGVGSKAQLQLMIDNLKS